MSDIAANLAGVRAAIKAAAAEAGREPAAVRLVAVSKTHPAEAVRAALACGQRVFGENRVQEAEAKYPALKAEFPELELHLIGPLQTNKVKKAVQLFDAIQTVDRPALAEALAKELAKELAKAPKVLALYVEVNTGEEPQKAGVAPAEADAFIRRCRDELKLPIVGLMCIPPAEDEPSLHFALLRKIADRNGLARLSMGMSADFETAVQFGATEVRVGTAIFGARPPA